MTTIILSVTTNITRTEAVGTRKKITHNSLTTKVNDLLNRSQVIYWESIYWNSVFVNKHE